MINNLKKMKILVYFLLIGFHLTANAQVYKSINLHKGSAKPSFFMVSIQDEKVLIKDLEDYLMGFGKVSTPEKYTKRLEKIKDLDISNDLNYIEIALEVTKKMKKVVFFFLDKDEKVLSDLKIKDKGAIVFIENFQKFYLKNLEENLLKENLKLAQDNFIEAKRYLSKIEKSLEANLNDQEKLGKKLDSSPEKLTKALSEKEEIISELFSETEKVNAKIDLEKASVKKEKEIARIQKEKEKTETKLTKKERAFDALKEDLFDAKIKLKASSDVLEDAKKILENFK